MKLLKPHPSWIHRILYEKYITNKRKPLVKVFESKEQAIICKRSLYAIKYKRNENFFISIRGTAVFIADNKDDFIYESIY